MKCLIFLGRLDDSLQVLWPFGPGKRMTRLVVAGDEAIEQFFQLLLAMLYAVGQTLLA